MSRDPRTAVRITRDDQCTGHPGAGVSLLTVVAISPVTTAVPFAQAKLVDAVASFLLAVGVGVGLGVTTLVDGSVSPSYHRAVLADI